MSFLQELKQRNSLLYWFGWFNMLVGLACIAGVYMDDEQVLGLNRWVKPTKFYLSVGIMVWTMNWLLYYLNDTKKVKRYSQIIVFSMLFENAIILLQAFRNTTSHFNTKTQTDGQLFSLMGILIMIFTIVCIMICIAFFRQRQFNISPSFVWGIRLGLLFFILFSLEGGVMLGLMKHTVGAADGTPGIPLLNWSKQYGDLRIAHFLGIHSLQVLPLIGFYVAKSKQQIILASALYFALVMIVLLQALKGIPLF